MDYAGITWNGITQEKYGDHQMHGGLQRPV